MHVCGFDCGGVSFQKYLTCSINKRKKKTPQRPTYTRRFNSFFLVFWRLTHQVEQVSNNPALFSQKTHYRAAQVTLHTSLFRFSILPSKQGFKHFWDISEAGVYQLLCVTTTRRQTQAFLKKNLLAYSCMRVTFNLIDFVFRQHHPTKVITIIPMNRICKTSAVLAVSIVTSLTSKGMADLLASIIH